MAEPLEYVYYRPMTLSGWLEYNSKTYNEANWKKWEEENDIPFEEIGKSFNEITDYVVMASDVNPNQNMDRLITENQIVESLEGMDQYLEKLSKDVYFPA